MAKTKPKMAKMRPNMRPRWALEGSQIVWVPTRNTTFCATGRLGPPPTLRDFVDSRPSWVSLTLAKIDPAPPWHK